MIMRRVTIIAALAIAWFLPSSGLFAQLEGVAYQWELKRDRDNIQIYTSKVPGSVFKAVRGEMVMSASVAELVALVNDLPRCKVWADLCETSVALEVVSSTEQYVHVHNDVPFPVKDRDVVAHVTWTLDPQTNKVSMNSIALKQPRSNEFKSVTRRAVRIVNAVSQWHFTPLDNGQVRVENFAHIDPNGPTPAWITNMLLVDSPFKTMSNMRREIETNKYQGATLPF